MEMIVQVTKTFGIMYRCWHFDELLVWWDTADAFNLFSPPSWKVVLQSSVTVWTFSPLVIVIVVVVFTKYSPSVHMNAVPERGVQNMQTVACVCVWFCSWMQSNKFEYSRSWNQLHNWGHMTESRKSHHYFEHHPLPGSLFGSYATRLPFPVSHDMSLRNKWKTLSI